MIVEFESRYQNDDDKITKNLIRLTGWVVTDGVET
jgi:hypothetical protein